MLMSQEFHVGDVGWPIAKQMTDPNGNPVNVAGAQVLLFNFTRPDDTQFSVNGSPVTDGTDGNVQYVPASGDLSQAGLWRVQVYSLVNGSGLYGDIETFRVWPNPGPNPTQPLPDAPYGNYGVY
jgi:hypothetical protein